MGQYLQAQSDLFDQVGLTLTRQILQHYGQGLLQHIQLARQEAIALELDRFTLTVDAGEQVLVFRNPADHQAVLTAVQDYLAQVFEFNQLWPQLSDDVWANVLAWSVQDLEPSIGASVLHTLDQAPFNPETWQALIKAAEQHQILPYLCTAFAQQLSDRLVQALALPQQPLPALEALLGLKPQTLPLLTLHWTQWHTPWTPILDLTDDIVLPQHPGAQGSGTVPWTEPPLTLTLAHPADWHRLPWDLAQQFLQHWGVEMVQIQLLLVAKMMSHSDPLSQTFTLSDTEVLTQIYQPPPLSTPAVSVRQGWLSIVSQLAIQTQFAGAPLTRFTGRLWDCVWEPSTSFQPAPAQPQRLELLVRPGLWLQHLWARVSPRVQTQLQQFGEFATRFVQSQAYRDPDLVRLLVYLMGQPETPGRTVPNPAVPNPATSRPSLPHPSLQVTVQELIHAIRPQAISPQATPQVYEDLWHWWPTALTALFDLGWRSAAPQPDPAPVPTPAGTPPWLTFYGPSAAPSSPPWLHPEAAAQRPSDWLGQWLALSLSLVPPQPSPLSAPSLRRPYRGTGSAFPLDRLTGRDIRAARKARRLTQAQLAAALHVHQSLIAKIETGDRSLNQDLEPSLRQLLNL